jgi:hypothetical protein
MPYTRSFRNRMIIIGVTIQEETMDQCPGRYGLTRPPLPREAIQLAAKAQDCLESLEDILAALKRLEDSETVLLAVRERIRMVAES